MLFSCAETDRTFPKETRRKVEDKLVEQKKMYYFQIFGGVNHGFAVRCDPNVENEREWCLSCSLCSPSLDPAHNLPRPFGAVLLYSHPWSTY